MQNKTPPYPDNFLPPDGMNGHGAHISDPQMLPFFDNTPGTTAAEEKSIEETASKERNKKRLTRRKKVKKNAAQIRKYNGVFALPVYLFTYRCMMECRYRFRKAPVATKYIAREIEEKLVNIMADISMVYWNILPYTRLVDTYREVLKVEVFIRSMRDAKVITAKDFGCICQYTAPMVTNMVKWSNKYNPDSQQINALSGLDVLSAQYEIPRVEDKEPDEE